jgi:hypothetical protein
MANEINVFEFANAKAVTELFEQESIACELRTCTTGDVALGEGGAYFREAGV